MKKKKQLKSNKNKQKTKSSKNNKENEENIPKEIGVFNDFLIYEKNDKTTENNINLSKDELDILAFEKYYLNIKTEPNQTESRFSSLFKEIMENDKKNLIEDEKNKNNKNKDNKLELNEEINKDNKNNKDNKDNKQELNEEINKDNKDNNNLFYSNTFSENKINENKISELNYRKTFFPNLGNFSQNENMNISSNSSGPNISSTNDTGYTLFTNSFLNNSLNKNSFDINKNNEIENKNTIDDYYQVSYFEPFVDIYKILSLEDKRTTIMIKNIPNKFSRIILLNTIDQHFKGTYDLFILPTDGNRNKNFGYSFINFTSSYFIPYFYFMFNNKKWSSTNSKKICEITYSKIQGRTNLISYYVNKIIFFNNFQEVTPDQKYIIPNEYKYAFKQLFPNQIIEEYNFYFITKMPN